MRLITRWFLAAIAALLLLDASPAIAASTFTQCLQLENPTPGDPAVTSSWGTRENNGRTLTDSAVAGALSLSIAGSSNVILTSTAGAPDQSRNAQFNFTGTLTGNVTIFWPNGLCRVFGVTNSTGGAFTLTLAVNNGVGAPAGSTVVVPQGQTMVIYDDGVNIAGRFNATPGDLHVNGILSGNGSGLTGIPAGSPTGAATGDLGGTYPAPTVVAAHFPGGLPAAQGGTGVTDGSNLLPPCAVVPFVGISAPTGYAVAQGQAVSRTGTTANLFACSTIQTTGNTHTSVTIDSMGSTVNMQVGMPVCGPTIQANTTVASIVNSNSITLSLATTSASNGVPIVVAPYGCGDGSTTFNVIDLRGRVMAGLDNGAGRIGNNTSAGGFTGTNFLGQAAGAQAHTPTLAEMFNHTHTASSSSSGTIVLTDNSGGVTPQAAQQAGTPLSVESVTIVTSTTVNPAGSSTPFTTTQPTVTGSYLVKL